MIQDAKLAAGDGDRGDAGLSPGLDPDVLAEAGAFTVLATAGEAGLTARELMRLAGPGSRAAVLAALERLAGQGAVQRDGEPGDESACWRLTPLPG